MHAYLIIGTDPKILQAKIDELADNLNRPTLEFPIKKIEEVRNLSRFTKLKVQSPTIILIRSIEEATLEAENAFLKNLEEPQENISYILTANSEYKILPTIISRCQVIKLKIKNSEKIESVKEFLGLTISQRLSAIDKIKDRSDALNFVSQLLLSAHNLLLVSTENPKIEVIEFLKVAQKAFNNLKANGNVCLQLTNFVVKSGLPKP
jgi:DNA polymerase III delta prime subunit